MQWLTNPINCHSMLIHHDDGKTDCPNSDSIVQVRLRNAAPLCLVIIICVYLVKGNLTNSKYICTHFNFHVQMVVMVY